MNLYRTGISGEGLESIPVLKQLETLNLEDCDQLINTGLLQLLAKCSATLKDINLHFTGISGEGLESVPVLEQLETLNLSYCRELTNTGLLQLLAKCSATLKDMNLYRTGISGEGLESIPVLKQFETLSLSLCR